MSAAMESLRARQIARRAARSSPSIAKPAAPCSAPVRASVPWVSPARRCRLDARIATLSGAQSRQGVSCRSTRAAADDGVVDIDADVIDDRVPITVITGFLGSGKTTLLNNILTQDHGQRIAVIENEFGEIDIDSELVASVQRLDGKEEQRIMMLNNGCLCCTVREDLVGMLNELVGRRDQFDRVVIETTGVANPAPIIQTFFLDPDMASSVRLDGIVTMVDAKHVGRHLDEQKPDGVVNEALQQIAYADRLVLNKTDLATSAELDDLEARLRDINSLAQVVRAERARVGVEYVLGVGGFDLERVEEEVNPDLLKQAAATTSGHDHDHDHSHEGGHDHSHEHSHSHDHEHGEHSREHSQSHASTSGEHAHRHGHGHGHDHHHHHHDDSVTSVSIKVDGEMDLEDVNYWLGALIADRGDDLYRMKGVIAIRDFPDTFVFQGVHSMFEGMPGRPWKDGEPRTSRMVFIGKDLDGKLIREGFQQCLTKEPSLAR